MPPFIHYISEADSNGLRKKEQLYQYPAFYRWQNPGNYVQASGAGRYVRENPGWERGDCYYQRPKPNRRDVIMKINKAQKRHKELDGLVKKLHEGNATGKIPDKHFTRLPNKYDEEQTMESHSLFLYNWKHYINTV